MRTWSRGRRTALAGALLLLLVPVPVHAQQEPGSALASYRLVANAPGAALEGLYKDVALTVPEVTSTLTTGAVGAGLSSLAWPGPVLGNAGNTILVLEPQAPPQVTVLNSPVRAESRTSGPQTSTNTTVPGTVMTTSAKPDEVTARAGTGESTQLPIGRSGSFTSSSRVALTGPATAVGEAESRVQHLSLAGGAIVIGLVHSTARATSDGRTASAEGSTTVTGMTVAGIPVTVDGSGVHVGGEHVPVAVPQDALDNAIRALGVEVHLTSPTTVKQGGSVRRSSGALVIVYRQGSSQYAVTLGRASVDLEATAAPPGASEAAPPTPPAPTTPVAGAPVPDGGGSALPAGTSAGTAPTVAAAARDDTGKAPLVPAAVAFARWVPVPLMLLGLAAAVLLAVALHRLTGRVLAVPAVDCTERLA